MGDDSDGTPTRRLGRRRQTTRRPAVTAESASTTYSFTRKATAAAPEERRVSVEVIADGVELKVNGNSLRLSRAEARRILGSLLELFG